MKPARLVLATWALVPSGCVLARSTVQRVFALGPDVPFEPFGDAWIPIKVGLYACAGLLAALALKRLQSSKRAAALPGCVALVIFAADQLPRGSSYLDAGIWRIGYTVSQLAPYKPTDGPLQSKESPALPPLTRVDVRTPVGPLSIATGTGRLRTFTWDGVTHSLELYPPDEFVSYFHTRRHKRGGIREPWYDWPEHKGIVCGEEWESVKSFHTQSEAEAWLASEQNETMPLVWSNDGLVVGWSTGVDSRSLSVMCYQVLLDGQKPTQLAGSRDEDVVVSALAAAAGTGR